MSLSVCSIDPYILNLTELKKPDTAGLKYEPVDSLNEHKFVFLLSWLMSGRGSRRTTYLSFL